MGGSTHNSIMYQVGKRAVSLPSSEPRAEGLYAAAIHQRTGVALAAINTVGILKGVYRFASHQEMNRHSDEAQARAVAMNVRKRNEPSA
jgi:hypothetical protein